MNRRQALIKKMAKRTKARENKKEKPNAGAVKDRYISKAERAKMEAEAAAALANAEANPEQALNDQAETDSGENVQPSAS